MCCSSGVARCLETTFLQREGLQPAPTGANICTPAGSLSNSLLTSDPLKDDNIVTLLLCLDVRCQMMGIGFFRNRSFPVFVVECAHICTFYVVKHHKENTRNSSHCSCLHPHKDPLTSVRNQYFPNMPPL